ncbi:MAG: response regulator [Burkholderiales bacterium]
MTSSNNKADQPAPRAASDEPTAFGERAKRVLIADDNRDWADGLAVLLEEEGYKVQTTYDGREAIEAAYSFMPDIVVLDIRMPRLTGYEAARVFNRHPSKTRPILIAITAWAGESGKLRAEMSGFDHYLAKPADPSEVLQLLKRL